MGMPGKGGSSPTVGAFGKEDRPFAEEAKTKIQGIGNDPFMGAAGRILMGQDPLSMQGGNLLSRILDGEFLDVSGGAYADRNKAITDTAQRFLNQNLDVIGGSAQRASGGVGSSSAETEATRRAVNEATSQVGETLGRLSAEDLARERGLQTGALQFSLDNLLKRAGGLSEFSQQPIDLFLKYLSTARQQPGSSQTGGLGELLGGLGGLGTGAGALITAFSDVRVKSDIHKADNEIDEMLEDLEAYTWKYKWENGDSRSIGVMAQDLEKSILGASLVSDGPGGIKMVDYEKAFPTMMAIIVRLSKRIGDLEKGHHAA